MPEGDRYVPRERWIANLIDAARAIADRETQEERWLAPDAYAWERPEELISVLFDDSVFEEFLTLYADSFSEEQTNAANRLREEMNRFCGSTPGWLDPEAALADARWESIRRRAAEFVEAFEGKWP